jgi:hypothetical protein
MVLRLFIFILVSITYAVAQESIESNDVGVPPSIEICGIYSAHNEWLPDAFITNAECACLKIPNNPEANIIREVLIARLDSVDLLLKDEAVKMKSLLVAKEISRFKYNKYVKSQITPIIYRDHLIAYQQAGCSADPAPYFGWKQITTKRIKNCNLVWFSIRFFGGSCSGRWGNW